MLRICVYTAVFAGYDRIVEHTSQSTDCDFIVFTDDPSAVPSSQFRIIATTEPGGQTLPGHQNLWLRLYPFDIPELNEYDILIYIDANVRIRDPLFIENILGRCEREGDFDLMLSVHPWNVCLYQEARDSQHIGKYANTDLKRQVEFYRSEGFPPFAGLFWNGFIVYNRSCNQDQLHHFQDLYWHETRAYCKTPDAHMQGQVSLPFCLSKCDLRVIKLQQLYRSHSLEISPHLR